jgi:hypothetical protein
MWSRERVAWPIDTSLWRAVQVLNFEQPEHFVSSHNILESQTSIILYIVSNELNIWLGFDPRRTLEATFPMCHQLYRTPSSYNGDYV